MNIANKNYALNFVFILYAFPNIASFVAFYYFGIFFVDMIPVKVGIEFWEQSFIILLVVISMLFIYWFCAREDRLLSKCTSFKKPSKLVGILVFFFAITFNTWGLAL